MLQVPRGKENGAMQVEEGTEKSGTEGRGQEEMPEKILPIYLLIYFKGILPPFISLNPIGQSCKSSLHDMME